MDFVANDMVSSPDVQRADVSMDVGPLRAEAM
jgi:hypothetical protein